MTKTICDRCEKVIDGSNLYKWEIVIPNPDKKKEKVYEVCNHCKDLFIDSFMNPPKVA